MILYKENGTKTRKIYGKNIKTLTKLYQPQW
jgi:hypothetical protein